MNQIGGIFPWRAGAALSNSLAIRAAMDHRLAELGRRTSVSLLERGAEVTVAGKTQVERELAQVVVLAKQVECARETQAQLIAIQRQAFHLLEHLGEINRRDADVGGDLGECPASRQIAGEDEFGSIRKSLASAARARRVRCARSERALHQYQREAFGLQWLSNFFAQAVAQHRYQRLRARVDAQAFLPKRQLRAVMQQRRRRQ